MSTEVNDAQNEYQASINRIELELRNAVLCCLCATIVTLLIYFALNAIAKQPKQETIGEHWQVSCGLYSITTWDNSQLFYGYRMICIDGDDTDSVLYLSRNLAGGYYITNTGDTYSIHFNQRDPDIVSCEWLAGQPCDFGASRVAVLYGSRDDVEGIP